MNAVQPHTKSAVYQHALITNLFQGYLLDDPNDTSKFVGLVQPMLFGYFRRHCRTITEAEDLTQECWARIHVGRYRFRQGMPVVPWLFGVARHTRLDAYRKSRIRAGLETAFAEYRDVADPQRPDLDERIEAQSVVEHFKNLTDSQQQVLVLYYLNDLPQQEVSRVLGCSEAAVKQKAFRARIALRESLEPAKRMAARRMH